MKWQNQGILTSFVKKLTRAYSAEVNNIIILKNLVNTFTFKTDFEECVFNMVALIHLKKAYELFDKLYVRSNIKL